MQENINFSNNNINLGGAEPQTTVPPMGFAPVIPPEEFKRHNEKKQIKSAANAGGLSFIFLTVFSFIISFLFGFVFTLILGERALELLEEPAVTQSLQVIFSLAGFTLPFLLFYKAFDFRISDLMSFKAGDKELRFPLFALGLAFCAFCNIGASYLGSILSSFGINGNSPEIDMPEGFFGFLLVTISTAVIPALVEEFAFRGFVMGSLRKFGDVFSLVASSVCFGLMHGNLGQIPFATGVGLYLGFTVLKTGSMRIAIILHFCNNFLSVALSYLPATVPTELQNIIYVVILLFSLLLGLVTLASSRIGDNFFNIKTEKAGIITTEKEKYRYFFLSPAIIIFGVICLAEVVLFMFL